MGTIVCTGADCPFCERDPRLTEALDILGEEVPDHLVEWLTAVAKRRPELTARDLVATYNQIPPPCQR